MVDRITFTHDMTAIRSDMLAGFFVGWPNPPSAVAHLAILRGSCRAIVALDGERVVGFITAVSDGYLASYLPLLEVLPEYQGHGLGTELVERMFTELADLYMVDLCCDPDVAPFYERFSMQPVAGMVRRNRTALLPTHPGGTS